MNELALPTVEETRAMPVEFAVIHGVESGLIKLSPDGLHLEFSDDISFEQLYRVMKFLREAGKKSKIWLADCWHMGCKKFGPDRMGEALQQLEFDLADVKTAMAIESVPSALRLPNLNAEHYVELSKTDDKKYQLKWARIASEKGLSATQLRFSMAENDIVDKAATKMLSTGVVTVHGIRQSFDLWARKVGGIEGIIKMDDDHQTDIMEELLAIVEFGNNLQRFLNEKVTA